MVYWHLDEYALCVYAQLKTCSSSEVGAMLKGILQHCTNMEMNQVYTDRHGQRTLAFGVSELLNFDLLPRLKNIYSQKLYYPSASHKAEYDNLSLILKEPINWKLTFTLDGLVHCKTEKQAKNTLESLAKRFEECGLQLHPDKTKIIYCKDDNRKNKYPNTSFDFLGYTFRPRSSWNNKHKVMFVAFTPSVSKTTINSMRAKLKTLNLRKRSEIDFDDIAKFCNPILKGWINYYGRFNPSGLYPVFRYFNITLSAWARQKYKRLYRQKMKATQLLEKIVKEKPKLFAHWEIGMVGAFA